VVGLLRAVFRFLRNGFSSTQQTSKRKNGTSSDLESGSLGTGDAMPSEKIEKADGGDGK
jgi:hypothetical protein